VQAQRAAAEARLRLAPRRRRVSAEEIERIIAALGDIVSVPADADAAKKATTYANLRLKLTYEPSQSLVRVESRPISNRDMYVRMCPRSEHTDKPMRPHR
jgi:hypothetical protein